MQHLAVLLQPSTDCLPESPPELHIDYLFQPSCSLPEALPGNSRLVLRCAINVCGQNYCHPKRATRSRCREHYSG